VWFEHGIGKAKKREKERRGEKGSSVEKGGERLGEE